jgi:hypothetical protein
LLFNAFLLSTPEPFQPARWMKTIGAVAWWFAFCGIFDIGKKVFAAIASPVQSAGGQDTLATVCSPG